MGNCFATICIASSSLSVSVVKLDGKLLQFRTPILVKDVLSNLSGAGAGIGVSRKAKKLLGPHHELRLGRIYYIVPCNSSSLGRTNQRLVRVSCTEPSFHSTKKTGKDGSCNSSSSGQTHQKSVRVSCTKLSFQSTEKVGKDGSCNSFSSGQTHQRSVKVSCIEPSLHSTKKMEKDGSCKSSSSGQTHQRSVRVSCTEPSFQSAKKMEKDGSCGVKRRIKIVITKQQLQDLLSEKISVEDVISETGKGADLPESWSPRLESIPEGSE